MRTVFFRRKNEFSKVMQLLRLFAALALFFCSACAPFIRSARWDREDINIPKIKEHISQNYSRLYTVSGKARLTYEMPGVAYSGFANIAVRLPDSVLVAVEAILGINVGTFYTDGQVFSVYIPTEKRVYSGDIERMQVAYLFQTDLGYEQLMATFTGIVQLPDSSIEVESVSDDELVLAVDSATGHYKLWLDAKYRLVNKAEYYDEANNLEYRCTYSRFQKSNGVVAPRVISIERFTFQERITLYYTQRSINIDPKKIRLQPQIPNDVEEVLL